MLTPRAPWWLPQPHEGETFGEFWLRIGLGYDDILISLDAIDPRATDVANDRLAAVCATRFHQRYRGKRDKWLRTCLA